MLCFQKKKPRGPKIQVFFHQQHQLELNEENSNRVKTSR